MPVAPKKLGYADFLKFPDDGNRHELIDGEWRTTPPSTSNHQAVAGLLIALLYGHSRKGNLGRVFAAPIGVILGRHQVVQPDVLFIGERRRSIIRRDGIHGAPDLVVEVLSPATADYDRREKTELYRNAGVREVWLVDLWAKSVEIREFGRTRRTRVFQSGQTFSSPLLPGLVVDVTDLFREIR